MGSMTDTDTEIECSVHIFQREAKHWLLITGELFGPFEDQEQAIDAIPGALRTLA